MARDHLNLAALDLSALTDLQVAVEGTVSHILKIDTSKLVRGLEARMSKEVTTAWKKAAQDAMVDGLEKLVQAGYTKEAIGDFLYSIGYKLKAPLTDRQLAVAKSRMEAMYKLSKQEAAKEAKGRFSFSLLDQRAINASANQQGFWVGKFYNDHLSKRISAVSTDVLLKQGLPHREAGAVLHKALRQEFGLGLGTSPSQFALEVPARYAGNPEYYFQQVASVSGHQSRVFARLSAFNDNGVITFELINPMDERTGKICVEMHGQVFSVASGVGQMQDIVGAKTPDEVRAAAPWLSPKVVSAALAGAPKGSAEASGKLAGLNTILPPFHPLCRTEPVIHGGGQPGVVRPTPPPRPAAPPPPPKPKPAPPPPAAQPAGAQLDQLAREKAKLQGYPGVATPGDGGMVENQDVRWRQENWGGKDHVVVRFKATPQGAGKIEEALRKMGAKQQPIAPFQASTVDAATGAIKHTGHVGDMSFSGLRVVEGQAQVTMITQNGAMKNLIEIRIPGSDPAKAHAAFEEIAKKMGIANPATAPTAAEVRALQQARIITQWDKVGWDELQRMGSMTPEKIDAVFTKAVGRNPKLKTFLDDMKTAEVAPGHVAQYSPAQARALQEAGVKRLVHDLSDPDRIPLLFEKDPARSGLLSSLQRYERGVFIKGASTGPDFASGGADSVFTRLSTAVKDTGSHTARIIIDPKVLGRSDWYFFDADRYGAAGPAQYGTRGLGDDIAAKARDKRFASGNEMMFQHGVSTSDMKCVVISNPGARARVIAKLKEKGITSINGKTLDEFIRLKE